MPLKEGRVIKINKAKKGKSIKNELRASLKAECSKEKDFYSSMDQFLMCYGYFIALGGLIYKIYFQEALVIFPLIAGALLILFFQLCRGLKRPWLYSLVLIGAVVALMLAIFPEEIKAGFILFLNNLSELLGETFGYIYPKYYSSIGEAKALMTSTLFLLMLSILFSELCSYRARNKNLFLMVLALAFEIATLICFGRNIAVLWYVLPIIAELMLFTLTGTEKEKQKIAITGRGLFNGVVLFLVAALLPLAVLSFTGIEKGYQGSSLIAEGREAAYNQIDKLRYGSSQGDNLPQGKLKNLTSLELTDTPVLEVIMSKPESLYLRGFVGSVYTGSSWQEVDSDELYKSSDLFYWLHRSGFYGQTQLSHVALMLEPSLQEDTINITVNNLSGRSKYIYTPYELLNADSKLLWQQGIGDESLNSRSFRGDTLYSYTAISNQVKRHSALAALLHEAEDKGISSIEGYLVNESHYNQFVYDTYTYLPEETKNLIKNHLGAYALDGQQHLDYTEAGERIIKYLSENTTYATEIASPKGDYDFLQSFLEVTKEGYSVHYATSAALMFRYYGIPSRYVEGYLITPQDVDGVLDNSSIIIDGNHAHAWVEIYRDGIGWVPFEATPPYFDLMEQDQKVEAVQGSSSKPDSTTDEPQSMEGDNYQEDGSTLWKELKDRLPLIITILLLLLVAALIEVTSLVIFKIIKRKQCTYKRLKAFQSEDTKKAVKNICAYTLELLFALGIARRNCYLNEYQEEINKLLGYELEEEYLKASEIFTEAAFSSHEISEDKRASALAFQQKLLSKIKASKGFKERLYLKYKYYLY